MNRDEAIHFIQAPGKWPAWPFLPLKRRTEGGSTGPLEFGFLVDDPDSHYTVYDGNIYDRKAVEEVKVKENHITVESLLDAGWEVD